MITLTNKRIRITFFLPSRKLGACENWGHRNYDIFESITRQCIRLTTFGTENSPIWTTECRSGIVVNKIRLSITVQNTNVIFLCAWVTWHASSSRSMPMHHAVHVLMQRWCFSRNSTYIYSFSVSIPFETKPVCSCTANIEKSRSMMVWLRIWGPKVPDFRMSRFYDTCAPKFEGTEARFTLSMIKMLRKNVCGRRYAQEEDLMNDQRDSSYSKCICIQTRHPSDVSARRLAKTSKIFTSCIIIIFKWFEFTSTSSSSALQPILPTTHLSCSHTSWCPQFYFWISPNAFGCECGGYLKRGFFELFLCFFWYSTSCFSADFRGMWEDRAVWLGGMFARSWIGINLSNILNFDLLAHCRSHLAHCQITSSRKKCSSTFPDHEKMCLVTSVCVYTIA